MKYIILLSVIFIYGCDGMYPNKDNYIVLDIGSKNCMVDSISLHRDTIRIYRSNRIYDFEYTIGKGTDTSHLILNNFDCAKIHKPYSLIRWNDGTYGILLQKENWDWYKDKKDFTYDVREAYHFKDSCEAKQNLKQFLDSRITYKIVK